MIRNAGVLKDGVLLEIPLRATSRVGALSDVCTRHRLHRTNGVIERSASRSSTSIDPPEIDAGLALDEGVTRLRKVRKPWRDAGPSQAR